MESAPILCEHSSVGDYCLWDKDTYNQHMESIRASGRTIRLATSAETISIIAEGFGEGGEKDFKRDFFDPTIVNKKWVSGQTMPTPIFKTLIGGVIIYAYKGVFVNPPVNGKGEIISDKETLGNLLNECAEFDGIWLYHGKDARHFGFAPYETFESGLQHSEDFAKGGLARVLEHTKGEVAEKLSRITSFKFYQNLGEKGCNVLNFYKNITNLHKHEKPMVKILGLGAGRGPHTGRDMFLIEGNGRMAYDAGYAITIIDESNVRE